ncbi:thiamine-phosphate kinase [Deferribacter autotrophicus]|uniref:Thiamine-monophosphate kinase n=1 Tax=Deferribacter autotrophicus TaxID=500465 RepID=A0A5A8F7V5_9BACT|nr:thiamine-phosphate kinase [Deferribacter autotrophicus]KAA0259213.1 thiamine-phosphate kinase [Deferribacter autotrophicus]
MDEKSLIKKLRNLSKDKSISLNLTDDAAVLQDFIISKDILIENVHFIYRNNLNDIILKAVTSNVSDIAAMGAEAKYLLLGLGLPDYIDDADLLKALEKALDHYKLDLIGGDLSKSALLFISVTIIGRKNKFLLTRKGAKPGDIVFVSRPLGKSIYYLNKELGGDFVTEHYHLEAEVELGKFLGTLPFVTSCTDISDGLGVDLASIADTSKVKIIIDKNKIPVAENISVSTDEILKSGEEYALTFTIDKKYYETFLKIVPKKVYEIGIVEKGSGVFLKTEKDFLEISLYGYLHKT